MRLFPGKEKAFIRPLSRRSSPAGREIGGEYAMAGAKGRSMSFTSNLVVALAVGAVFVVLLLGLFNMLRGGASNQSQMLMRWRVGLQFLAIVAIVLVLWMRGHW